jgi:hypothetical protein
MSKITTILDALGDGRWHGAETLLLRFELSEHKFWEIMAFLNKYGFVKVDEENRRVKINRDFQKLVAQAVT